MSRPHPLTEGTRRMGMRLSPLAKLCIRGVAMQDYLQSQASSHAALPGNEATHTLTR